MSAPLTIAAIRDQVAAASGFTVPQLVSRRKDKFCVEARRIAIFIAHRQTAKSLAVIGRSFGDRDHTTVLASLRAIATRVAVDPLFAAKVEGLELLCLAQPQPQQEQETL